MRFISRILCLSFFHVLLGTVLLFSTLQAEAPSHAVTFIVDFSESMKEKIGKESKEEIVRDLFDGILEGVRQPLDAELIFFGHTDKDSCDDAEVVVPSQEFVMKKVKEKLSKTSPQGRGGIDSAVQKAIEKLHEKKDLFLSIVIFTDGKETCTGDLVKTAKEIKEKFDYRVTFHIIGLNPARNDRPKFASLGDIGYGSYHEFAENPYKAYENPALPDYKEMIEDYLVKTIVQMINEPEMHYPKVIGEDEMVLIPAGEFFMGSESKNFTSPHERPGHQVYLDSFFIDKYEVTEQQYKSVMGENPSYWHGSDLPVHVVSWDDAKEYCKRVGKRLPSEAEWEKAAKGGRNDKWSGTNDAGSLGEYAWIDDRSIPSEKRSGSRPHPVGTKKPNGYGIYDMSGNLWEWISDWYGSDYYKTSPKANPTGPEKGQLRVLRGGSWDSHLIEVRTAGRIARYPEYKDFMIGFRCARDTE